MIYNVWSLKELKVFAKFTDRIEAMGYIDFNDPKREDLFFREEKTADDFMVYRILYTSIIFMSKIGGTYFC